MLTDSSFDKGNLRSLQPTTGAVLSIDFKPAKSSSIEADTPSADLDCAANLKVASADPAPRTGVGAMQRLARPCARSAESSDSRYTHAVAWLEDPGLPKAPANDANQKEKSRVSDFTTVTKCQAPRAFGRSTAVSELGSIPTTSLSCRTSVM